MIRCGVLRGMKQMSPGPRSRLRSPTICVPRPLTTITTSSAFGWWWFSCVAPYGYVDWPKAISDAPVCGPTTQRTSRCPNGPSLELRGVVSARRTRGAAVGAARLELREELRDRRGGRLRRLERDRVPDARELDDASVRERAGELAAVLGQGAVVEAADDDEHRLTDLAEPAGEALRRCDRAALADVVGGIVLEQEVPVLVEDRRSRCSDGSENGGFFDQYSATHVSSPMLSIRSAEASMRGARFERSASPPISTSASTPSGRSSANLSAIARPERVPDEDRSLEPEAVEHGAEVVRPARERELAPLELARPAGAAQVDEDELVAGPNARDPVPERAREAEAVDEHDRRSLPHHLDVELHPVDDNLLLGHLASFAVVTDHPSERRRRRRSPAPTARRRPRATG